MRDFDRIGLDDVYFCIVLMLCFIYKYNTNQM